MRSLLLALLLLSGCAYNANDINIYQNPESTANIVNAAMYGMGIDFHDISDLTIRIGTSRARPDELNINFNGIGAQSSAIFTFAHCKEKYKDKYSHIVGLYFVWKFPDITPDSKSAKETLEDVRTAFCGIN